MPRGDCNGYRHRISRSWLTCEDIPNLYGTSLVLPERRSIAPLITAYSLADKQPWKEGMHVTQPPGAHGRSMAGSNNRNLSRTAQRVHSVGPLKAGLGLGDSVMFNLTTDMQRLGAWAQPGTWLLFRRSLVTFASVPGHVKFTSCQSDCMAVQL